MAQTNSRSSILHDILERIHYIYDESELADAVLSEVARFLEAEGGSVFRVDERNHLRAIASFGAPLERLRRFSVPVGKGIVGWVAQNSRSVRVDDVEKDTRFFKGVDRVTGFSTRCAVAAPIVSHGRCLGVIEFLNRRGGPFRRQDLEIISLVGRQVGIAFENARLVNALEASLAFQDAFLKGILAGVVVVDQEGRLVRMNPGAERILQIDYKPSSAPRPVESALGAFAPLVKALRAVVEADEPVHRQELRLPIRGREARIGYSGIPLFGGGGRRLGSAILFQDITEWGAPDVQTLRGA